MIPHQATIYNTGEKLDQTKKQGKWDRMRKHRYLLLYKLWLLLPKFCFWGRDWVLGYVQSQYQILPNIS